MISRLIVALFLSLASLSALQRRAPTRSFHPATLARHSTAPASLKPRQHRHTHYPSLSEGRKQVEFAVHSGRPKKLLRIFRKFKNYPDALRKIQFHALNLGLGVEGENMWVMEIIVERAEDELVRSCAKIFVNNWEE